MNRILELRERCLKRLPPNVLSKYRQTELDAFFLVIALCGEVGELANLFKKMRRGDPIKMEAIVDEMADIRVYLELLAKLHGVDLEDAVEAKLEKIVERYRE